MRMFSGKILIRITPKIHKELAREAFEKGRSINQLCMEAILARKALKTYDPWKSIEELWEKQKGVHPEKLAQDIRETVKIVRRARKAESSLGH